MNYGLNTSRATGGITRSRRRARPDDYRYLEWREWERKPVEQGASRPVLANRFVISGLGSRR